MQRAIIPLALLVLAGGVWFMLNYNPQGGVVHTAGPTSSPPDRPITDAEVPLERPVRPPPQALASEVAPASAESAAPPSGPFDFNMGEYQIALRDSPKRMRMSLRLTTSSEVTLRELRGRREQIRRMIYFLSAHRPEEGMVGEDGRQRFEADLRERFANIVRTGPLDKVEITTWVLEDVAAAPATVGDPK